MSRERWELLKDIFSQALEQSSDRREDFVREAVGGDMELLAELRRLLDEHDRHDSSLSRPALEPQVLFDDAPPQFAPETVLAGRFRILRYIARGGMGEVYEAEDLVLKERVALKTIRAELAHEEQVLTMFRSEIQLARMVTHPNVCRIHDFAEHIETLPEGGRRATSFLTMELLGGETLAQYVSTRGPLRPEQALPILQQLVSALEAAHAAGVIHRDLKPGNIMVIAREDPEKLRVVVTDFGMAILAQEAAAHDSRQSRGTPRYMAPEQVEGGAVSPATDVYSLALVIAEMIGARRLSASGSRIRTLIGLIPLKHQPTKLALPPGFAAWASVLRKSLEYDPARRYGRPAEVIDALFVALRVSASRWKRAGLITALLAVIFSMALVWQRWARQSLTPTSHRVFVEDANTTVWRASPDGRLLAATEYANGIGNLIVRDVTSGQTRQLTRKTSPGGASNAIFSHDGRWIAYSWNEDESNSDLRMIPLDGGAIRKLYSGSEAGAVTMEDWSPDGNSILVSVQQIDDVRIGLVSVGDGSLRIFNDSGTRFWKPRFSADGNSFFADVLQAGDELAFDIGRFNLNGVEQGKPVHHSADDDLVGLSRDGTSLLFRSDRQGAQDLWSTPIQSAAGGATRLWPNLGRFDSISMTRSGAFYYRLEPQVQEVYTAAIDIAEGSTITAPKRVMERFRGASLWPWWSPDGRQLLFNYRIGGQVLAIHTPATNQTRIVRPQLEHFQRPQWHPSGKWIASMGLDREAGRGIFRVDPFTGAANLLITARELENGFEGVWSSDGVTMFNRFDDGRRGIFRIRLDTRNRQVLYVPPAGTDIGLENLALSPDGMWLAFHARQRAAGTASLMVIPAAGGTPRALLTISRPEEFMMGSFAWAPDSQSLLAVRTRGTQTYSQLSEIWRVPLDGGPASKIDFPAMRIAQLRLSPDGKTIAFTSGRAQSEIWVLEGL